jgi:L-ascorbate metabolism protein UlaG (beta-lactamase superfamily)
MKISMIGHSSTLIEMGDFRILTDPYFGLRGNLIYSRPKPPSCKREDLADVDLVLVSHNHFDHTDPGFFRLLPADTPILAPSKTAWVTKLKGGTNVLGIKPWQQKVFGDIKITAVPAWHTTITHGFVIESEGMTIYFAADTYHASFMERIAQEFKPQVVLMPVTTFRIPLTMGERGALAATRVLSPKVIIPIHLGISPRSPFMRTSQTPRGFEKRLRQDGISTQVVLLNEGETWSDTP